MDMGLLLMVQNDLVLSGNAGIGKTTLCVHLAKSYTIVTCDQSISISSRKNKNNYTQTPNVCVFTARGSAYVDIWLFTSSSK